MNMLVYNTAIELCRKLRECSTPTEEKLWSALRHRKSLGKKFLRQHPIFFKYIQTQSFFIADFYCSERKLIIEIDGKSRDYQKEYDKLRAHLINALGIKVIRFKNSEIENDLPSVLERLEFVLTH
jgi:very-short-patch-repair endonuclease